jgi:adenylate cyclase
MPSEVSIPATEDLLAQLKALERENRGLKKQLTRSEAGRVQLEMAKDRFDALHQSVIQELDEKAKMLEGLSSKLSKYLAPQVYSSIFAGRREVKLATERKQMTIFFSDIKDFASTAESLQPEELTRLLNHYFSEMSKIATAHGATLDKFIGDAMLMFFGDPETKGVQQDAHACVAMAIAMQQQMREIQEQWRAEGIHRPLQMRIGINTGYCNVGNFGSSSRMDYTVIGAEVNLAARLESAADPDGILMSYETYALVRDFVQAEERKEITTKGINREVRTFAVTNIHSGHADEERLLRRELQGFTLLLDFAQLTDADRRAAIREIEAALDRLRH